MTKLLKILVGFVVAIFAMNSLTACSSSPLDMANVAAVIDVRTPSEFATGHLEGALNFDIQGSEFEMQIATLTPSANYVIYCRSGNRAGQAVSRLQDAGFSGTLTNAGGVEEASSFTKLPIVY